MVTSNIGVINKMPPLGEAVDQISSVNTGFIRTWEKKVKGGGTAESQDNIVAKEVPCKQMIKNTDTIYHAQDVP